MNENIKEIIAERIKYHSNKEKYGYFIGKDCIDICASDILDDVIKAGYRKQSETITFYKDPNIRDWAESEYAWCERPCDSNMSMQAIDKKGNIVGYASEHYWTWCDVEEVKKVSAIEFMRHFASKRSETVKEFAEKLTKRLTKEVEDNPEAAASQYKAGLYFAMDLAEQFGKEEKNAKN
jgi:hypothetical protein